VGRLWGSANDTKAIASRAVKAVSIALLVMAALVCALGLTIFLTERGVANEIKGFVLMLIGAVLLVGGCVLWELRAIRRALEQKDPR
jgi:cytochrome bd-type quinol oxidase subunit 2